MLWTRLRDSVSVALLPPPRQPQTHAGTHTSSFSLSFILFSPLSYSLASLTDNTWLFLADRFFFLTQLQRYCTCVLPVLLSIYYMLSNSCLLQFLSHLKQPQSHITVGTVANHWPSLLSVLSLSTLLYEIDKCIGYWLSPMPTSTSIRPLPWPPPLPPLYLLPGRGWCQSGRPWGPSGDQWAVTGSSSASLSLQSGARWGLVRELSLPKWPHSNWEGKKKKPHTGRGSRHFHFPNWTALQTNELTLVTLQKKCFLLKITGVSLNIATKMLTHLAW